MGSKTVFAKCKQKTQKMSETVTVTLSPDNYFGGNNFNPFNLGQIIKIKQHKRYCLQIRDISTEPTQHTIAMVRVINPAPKSRLRNKTIFSKVKVRIINPNQPIV